MAEDDRWWLGIALFDVPAGQGYFGGDDLK